MVDASVMRCFYVLVHSRMHWRGPNPAENDPATIRPLGFYCHRYVLATGERQAEDAAFRRVRDNLENQTGWIGAGLAIVDLEAEELTRAPMHKLLRSDNRGHTFYLEE